MTSKYCTKCGELKPFYLFHKDSQKADKLTCRCRDCINKTSLKYKRSKNGIISQIYNKQKHNSFYRDHKRPSYSLEELKSWAFCQPIFHSIYNTWVESNYAYGLSPSFDRNNDYLPYTLDNLTVMTWAENNQKCHYDRKHGINNKQARGS